MILFFPKCGRRAVKILSFIILNTVDIDSFLIKWPNKTMCETPPEAIGILRCVNGRRYKYENIPKSVRTRPGRR